MDVKRVTNEYTSQGLIYLRSRTYDPSTGRFLTKDSWQGDYNRPLSLNRWMYVEGNPINFTDPSGYCNLWDLSCQELLSDLEDTYSNIDIDDGIVRRLWLGKDTEGIWRLSIRHCSETLDRYNSSAKRWEIRTVWDYEELQSVEAGLGIMSLGLKHLGGNFRTVMGSVVLKRIHGDENSAPYTLPGVVRFDDRWATDPNYYSRVQAVIHEFGHVATFHNPKTMNYFMEQLGATCSNGTTSSGVPYCLTGRIGTYNPGKSAGDPFNPDLSPQPTTYGASQYGNEGNWEDYAETFLTVVIKGYLDSGDSSFRDVATQIWQGRNQHIGKRQDVMSSILTGSWR